jgi:hypothetical protein
MSTKACLVGISSAVSKLAHLSLQANPTLSNIYSIANGVSTETFLEEISTAVSKLVRLSLQANLPYCRITNSMSSKTFLLEINTARAFVNPSLVFGIKAGACTRGPQMEPHSKVRVLACKY